ncbi:MAG TPA: LLM class flavin-dependent oxidoreductase, partial [Actinomycetota bacterium]
MKIGLTLPQGCDREYLGLDAETAWARTVDIARRADEAGFGSLWLYDHFLVDPPPEEAIVFEPFVEAAALSAVTTRAQIGFLVLCAAYRPAALTAKMISTLDVVSGGRAVLGLGAGWKQDEWEAFGYGFPEARTRLAILRDHLEVIT